MKRLASLLAGVPLAIIVSSPAHAQVASDLPGVVRVACAAGDPTTKRPLGIETLSEAILIQSGYPVGDLVALARTTKDDAYRDAVVKLVTDGEDRTDPFSERVGRNVNALNQAFAAADGGGKSPGIAIVAGPPRPAKYDRYWFLRTPAATQFQCDSGEKVKSIIEIVSAPKQPPVIAITKAVEDLGKTDGRATVDAAVLGVKVSKTVADDGSIKKTTTLTFDGTVGVRVLPVPTPGFFYANYTLSKARVKPPPQLDPGKTQRDGDTDGLALGFTVQDIRLPFYVNLTAGTSYVMDFVKGSRRGVGSLTFSPGFNALDAGICGFGYLKTLNIGKVNFRTRCSIAGEFDYSHVLKAGTTKFEDRGDFFSVGPVAGFDILAPLNESTGIVGNVRYRFLPTISGVAPTVHRWDVSLKYRWWVGDGVGLDFGGTYKKGEEFKTYTKEDEFLLTFGIVR
jgi:hypothetical protein